jgi:hypothetical protein
VRKSTANPAAVQRRTQRLPFATRIVSGVDVAIAALAGDRDKHAKPDADRREP